MIVLRLLFQTVVLALSQIWANKVRALLTTLGVIIGVGAIVAVVSSLTGFERFILGQFDKIGTKRVFIQATVPPSLRNKVSWFDVQLTMEEVRAIADRCPSIAAVCPMWYGGYSVESAFEKIEAVSIPGIWPSWHEIEGRSVLMGRPFNSIDEQERRQVCLINEEAIRELRLDDDPVEEYLLIGGRRFLIVGVVETIQLSAMFGGGNTSAEVFIPFSTARDIMNPRGRINFCWGQLASADVAEDAEAEIRFVLRSMRAQPPDQDDTFNVRVFQQFIDQFRAVAAGVTFFMFGIVGISLLVGGIGIMNIMLVSVSERTREIGLRKAVGARPAVILLQFLVEAVVLCLIGAAIGLACGQALVFLMRIIPNSPLSEASTPIWAIVLSAGFSVATGVIFGMFPAIKAARLDPIVALRHE
ncbi:MAG: ABC transporter permease [Phycisphaeraceae bacterium]|nr:ABC transporter permease [Phycisphaeraceae bacterium]